MNTRIKKLLGIVAVIALTLSGIHPAYSQKVRGSFEESKIIRNFKKQREAAFSQWMTRAQLEEQVKRLALTGKVLFVVERNTNGQMRAVFDSLEKTGMTACYVTAMSESQLMETHASKKRLGFEVLFLSKNPTGDNYSVTWVEKEGHLDAIGKLAKLGVSPAKIELKQNQNTEPFTSEIRQWTDRSGRSLHAALADIDGDKIILVKKGRGRFPYSIVDLSLKDQQFLKQIASDHQKTANETVENVEADGTFTDWHSFYEWNELLKQEKSKGRYPVYVENNKDRELRGIFDKMPEGMKWNIGWLDSETDLLRMNSDYKAEGLTLLSLSFDRRNELYYGMWVSNTTLGQAKGQLEAAGISLADIGKKIKVSRVSK